MVNDEQGFLNMHHPTDRIAHTTAFVRPVAEHWMERNIAQWVINMLVRLLLFSSNVYVSM